MKISFCLSNSRFSVFRLFIFMLSSFSNYPANFLTAFAANFAIEFRSMSLSSFLSAQAFRLFNSHFAFFFGQLFSPPVKARSGFSIFLAKKFEIERIILLRALFLLELAFGLFVRRDVLLLQGLFFPLPL